MAKKTKTQIKFGGLGVSHVNTKHIAGGKKKTSRKRTSHK